MSAPWPFCPICMRGADEDELTVTLPDGCRVHHSCWLRADYAELRMHAEPHLHDPAEREANTR